MVNKLWSYSKGIMKNWMTFWDITEIWRSRSATRSAYDEGGMENDEKAGMETRQYVISGAGSYGKLRAGRRDAEYNNRGMGRNDLQRPGDAFDFRPTGAVFV